MQKIKALKFITIIHLLAGAISNKAFAEVERKIKFNIECMSDDTYVTYETFVKFKEMENYISINCNKRSKSCTGVELFLTHELIFFNGINPLVFDADSVSDNSEYSIIKFKHIRYVYDKKNKKLTLTKDYHMRMPPEVEVWEGKCGDKYEKLK